jgi:hypothetical protein
VIPARLSIGVDLDEQVVGRWAERNKPEGLRLLCCDGIEWLRFAFDLDRVPSAGSRNSAASAEVAYFGVFAAAVFVYCDPPYLLSCRRSKQRRYKHEMAEADHVRLLEVLRQLPSPVMVSHYPCDLYSRALDSWETWTYRSQTRSGYATEQVWCNYLRPESLHDPRYLGGDKRERERIRRRVRNWTAGLAKMPALERQAVLDAIRERYGVGR